MTKPTFIEVDRLVERLGSKKDYTTGRQGKIIEIDIARERARVRWHSEGNGKPISADSRVKNTWVKWTALAAIRIQGNLF